MKRYQGYKNSYKVFLFLLLIALPVWSLFAQTADDIRSKIEEKNRELQKLEQQIQAYQQELAQLNKQKASLNGSLKELDVTRKKLNADIAVTQNKINKTTLEIEELTGQIGTKEKAITNATNSLAADLRLEHEMEQESLVERMLASQDFSLVWRDIDNMITIRESIASRIKELRDIKSDLETTRQSSISAKQKLTNLKTELGDQKKVVDHNAAEKNKLLTQTKSSEATYQKLLVDELARREAFQKELRAFESQLKFILDPSKLPSAGVLSWPLDYIYVTQQFGAKTGPHRTYASGHSGTDFRARTPVPAYAMADGVVKGVGDTDQACPGASFGKWIFIEYSNGLSSTYGHMSLIKVSEGQRVARGEVVGYTGGTGRVTGPHLHVSLYSASGVKVDTVPSQACPGKILRQPIAAITAYLDPMYYLPPYTSPL